MAPVRPQFRTLNRERLRLPRIIKRKKRSFLDQHYYAVLAVTYLFLSVLGKAVGLDFRFALLVAFWVTSIVAFSWQIGRYLKHRANPPKEVKPRR